jgi:TPR repeat protein
MRKICSDDRDHLKMTAVGRCLATLALLVVICSAHAAVAQNGWYVVPNDYLNPPDDAYHRGINAIGKDTAEAIKWYRIAADQGDPRAQYALGFMNAEGGLMPQNYAEAIKWWRRSADQGYARAQCDLGIAYANGEEVTQDFVRAHMWLNIAAAAPASAYETWAETNYRQLAVEQRNLVARKMTFAQIAEAQKLAKEWKPKLER